MASTLLRLIRLGPLKTPGRALGGLGLCVGATNLFVWLTLWISGNDAWLTLAICSLAMPVLISAAIFFFMSLKLEKLSVLNGELENLASRDGMTALLNRTAFSQGVQQRMLDIEMADGGRGSLLIIDADFFKSINDRWGHSIGDEALRRISARLVEAVGPDDLVARLGGEEFGVFISGAGFVSAKATAERVRSGVELITLASPTGELVPLSVSIGGVFFRESLPFELLFQLADRRLYQAKANGRNRVEMEEFAVLDALSKAA